MEPRRSETSQRSRECSNPSGLTREEVSEKFEVLIRLSNERHASGTCILANEGCPPGVAVPTCPPEFLECARFLTLDEFDAKAPELEGKKVALRGKLQRARHMTTLVGCAEGTCCNQAGAMLSLDEDLDKGLLLDANNPSMFRCIGDDSVTCCPIDLPSEDVAATGNVERWRTTYGLGDVSLCRISTAP